MRKNTPVREWMSRLPVEIEETRPVAEAHEIMEQGRVRHLPVMQGSHLTGIVSLHDLDAARAAGELERPVGEIGPRTVLTVSPTETLPKVCQRMAEEGVGSAVIVDGTVVVGIFTASDAVRFLAAI